MVMILFAREGIYERLRRRVRPSLVVFVLVIAVQILLSGFDDRELISQISLAMLAVIALLLVPDGFYAKIANVRRREPAPA